MELKRYIYSTVHRGRPTVEELADGLGCSSSLLYRCANPNDPAARFPLEKLLPLMRLTKDYSILRHIAARAGFALFRIPPKRKTRTIFGLTEFQALFAKTFQCLLNFVAHKATKEEVLEEVDKLLSRTVEVRHAVAKSEQLSFEFEE